MTDFNRDLDPAEVMTFIRERGAVSIKEAKEHFGVNSKSMRRAFAKLWYHDKVWILPYRRALYATENTGKAGNPSIKTLRKVWTEGHPDGKPKRPNYDEVAATTTDPHVKIERGRAIVSFRDEE